MTIPGCPVVLPDIERVLACEQGTIVFEGGLELKNVLYVTKIKMQFTFCSTIN